MKQSLYENATIKPTSLYAVKKTNLEEKKRKFSMSQKVYGGAERHPSFLPSHGLTWSRSLQKQPVLCPSVPASYSSAL